MKFNFKEIGMSKFKVGDKVFHVGHGIGTVVTIDKNFILSVAVEFNKHLMLSFLSDGRAYSNHTIPQLYTLEDARKMGFDIPKQKVKKTIEQWANVYPDGTYTVHFTEDAANAFILLNDSIIRRIACVKLTGEYEVEE